ncbi:MAG: EfeM/EfeO family lipoprotein [Nannocystaceae bacterium]|nr:EfeM/EfeO family lipoprotein [Nannocystaceae bacterium]
MSTPTRTCALLLLATACASSEAPDPEREAIARVKQTVTARLQDLADATQALHDAAPAPDADGWNATADADAVLAMRGHWADARDAYESIEGAIAVLFPDLDAATDERYDGFLGEGPDDDLFDDEGVIGVHAVERILWADAHPAWVVEFESALPGYQAAAYPANAAQATAFRDALTARLVRDVQTMRDDFEPLALDSAAAYGGVLGSMAEQAEKVSLAATGEDESRYAQYTLADMRANLAGGREVFEAFEPWLREMGGDDIADDTAAQFDTIAAAYDAIDGDALPQVPATWDPTAPSAEDLATPYGTLWQLLQDQTDPAKDSGVVSRMSAGADLLDIPVLP